MAGFEVTIEAQSTPDPAVKIPEHFGRVTISKIPTPAAYIPRHLDHSLLKAFAVIAVGDLSDSVLKPL